MTPTATQGLNPEEQQALHAFATRYRLTEEAGPGSLPIRGALDEVELLLHEVRRGTHSSPCPTVEFRAQPATPFAGGLVAYKPNFYWRLPGPRRIGDDIGVTGLLGFVHRDKTGDAELDKKLIVFADDPSAARPVITHPDAKSAILSALAAAGHIRINRDHVSLDVARRGSRGSLPLASPETIQTLALAAKTVAEVLSRLSR